MTWERGIRGLVSTDMIPPPVSAPPPPEPDYDDDLVQRVHPEEPVTAPLLAKRTAIEVVRRGRFSYAVVERYVSGVDASWEPTHLFRWTAVRHARRIARPEPASEVVFRLSDTEEPA